MIRLRFFLLAHLATAFVSISYADSCLDEVKALYQKEWNPFLRKPYRSVKTVYSPDGTKLRTFENVVETPLKTISGISGGEMGLVIDHETWTGPTADGPWTKAPFDLPKNRKESLDANYQLEIEGLSEAVCHGEVELQGRPHLKYEFHVRTAPNPLLGGLWAAARNTIWLDIDTRMVTQWEQTDFETSFQPELNKERQVTVFTYDESIQLKRPE